MAQSVEKTLNANVDLLSATFVNRARKSSSINTRLIKAMQSGVSVSEIV